MQKSYVYDRIKQLISHLNILKRNIKEDILEQNKERARQHLVDIILLVQEAHYQRGAFSQLDLVVDILEMQLDAIYAASDKKKLEEVIEKIASIFSEEKYKSDLSSYRKYNNFRYAVEVWRTNHSFRDIISNTRHINVLSYDAPEEILEEKDVVREDINMYGICINTGSYKERLVSNIAYGTGGNSNITNNAFDVIVLMPPTTSLYTPIGIREDVIPKQEWATIGACMKYLRPEGLISLVMPYTRLDSELCAYLCRNFFQITVNRVNDILIELNGLKKVEKAFDSEEYTKLRNIYKEFKELKYVAPSPYELPQQQLQIASFRGSRITTEMLESAKEKSSAISKIIQSCIEINDLASHKPLLPFNTGQIGLVLASGCLDGIVHENEKDCHLIKGRVERKTEVARKRGGNEEITVYHSVQINALTPDGKLIEIS